MTKSTTKGLIFTIKKTDDCENVYGVNPLYLLINQACGYIQEKNGNKFLMILLMKSKSY